MILAGRGRNHQAASAVGCWLTSPGVLSGLCHHERLTHARTCCYAALRIQFHERDGLDRLSDPRLAPMSGQPSLELLRKATSDSTHSEGGLSADGDDEQGHPHFAPGMASALNLTGATIRDSNPGDGAGVVGQGGRRRPARLILVSKAIHLAMRGRGRLRAGLGPDVHAQRISTQCVGGHTGAGRAAW